MQSIILQAGASLESSAGKSGDQLIDGAEKEAQLTLNTMGDTFHGTIRQAANAISESADSAANLSPMPPYLYSRQSHWRNIGIGNQPFWHTMVNGAESAQQAGQYR